MQAPEPLIGMLDSKVHIWRNTSTLACIVQSCKVQAARPLGRGTRGCQSWPAARAPSPVITVGLGLGFG